MKTLFEKSKKGKRAFDLPEFNFEGYNLPDELARESKPELPELCESEVVEHYINLSGRTHGLDERGIYPLGSCTMKYNPIINEKVVSLDGFCNLHPLTNDKNAQGALRLIYTIRHLLSKLTGFDDFSVQPAAGAQAEFTALLITKEYFKSKGEIKRDKVLIPDVAHGTNPASVALAGWEVKEIKTNGGLIDLESLKFVLDDTVACVMVTNPNTLGVFEKDIVEINRLVHEAGGLSYWDGANFNAMIGRYLPRKQGFDLCHLNLHKTFSTPHGGGGPGVGALGVVKELERFLPVPRVVYKGGKFYHDFARSKSIGKVNAFYGNFLVYARALAYILTVGNDAHKISEGAIANAQYLFNDLSRFYNIPYDKGFLHEFVISCKKIKEETGVEARHIAKRLMDYGFHPPTMYFPMTVKEALMVEPTETASKEALDEFIDAMIKIYQECYNNPEIVKTAPHKTKVTKIDEVGAARPNALKVRA